LVDTLCFATLHFLYKPRELRKTRKNLQKSGAVYLSCNHSPQSVQLILQEFVISLMVNVYGLWFIVMEL
jgi:hypothetical protein